MPKPLKILQASAGSGKTFSLTAHYLTLLFSEPNKYREILAVTFTNKATEEMKTRILEVLRGFARGDKKYDNYKTQVLSACPSLQEAELRLKADQTYRKILHDYSRFSVHTIDGFVQKVIRGFAFELGLDAGYTLEMNYDKVKTELANKLDKALDQQPQLLQWIIDLAIERINDNVSWNYRNELLNLASELFKERYQPFEQAIATLGKVTDLDSLFKDYQTLTKQKIAGFEQRIEQFGTAAQQLFEVLDPDVTALKGKSRSPLFNLKKIAGGDLSKVQGVNKLVDAPEEWFQKDTFELHGNREIFEELNPVLKELTTVFQQESAAYITAQSFNKNLYYLRLMQEMAAILKGYREENGNLLISDAQNLLKGITEDADDNPSFIWEKMGNRYKNFLFDEFQDTSANQWGSFKSLLTNAIAAPSGKLTDHLIVGDTKQSIYRWRNGDWNILHQYAKNDVGPHNVVEESLEENYRSSRNIIDFNNSLFTALSQLLQQHLNNAIEDTDNAIAGWWQNMGFDKIVTSVYANAIQKTTPATPAGGTIKYTILKTDAAGLPLNKNSFTETALEQTIEEIRYLITVKKYQPKDICILVRKNAEAVAAVKALLENNINVISGEALLIANNNGVKLILNTLRVLAGASGQTALFKANCISLYARLQGNKVTPGSLFGLNFKTLDQLGNVLPPELCTAWQTWMQQPLPELVEKIIGAYGLNTKTADLPYLFAFRDLAGRFAQQGEQGVAAFMCFWEEEGVKKTLPSTENEDAVQVITIHKSKGLAFRAVMLPFCNWPLEGKANGIFWVPAKDTPYHLLDSIPLKYNKNLGNSTIARAYFEELLFSNMDNLNTLYVATTRAKEYIYITSMGKKAESISNIGDLLASALDEKMAGESTYVIDEPVAQKEAGIQEGTPLTLTSYPIVNRLSTVFDADLKRREIELLTGKDAGRMGSILHEVLANTHQKAGLETVLEDMLNAGLFKAEELQELKAQAMTVLEHTALQQILNKSTETLTEQTIIAANGKSYRPDKVLINEDGVSIIDYKFTQEESDKHIEQVDHYKNLLVEMGYTNVKTYLFYAHTGLLKQV